MTRIIVYLSILFTSMVFAQEAEKTKVKAAVDTFFEGFHKGDTVLMKSVMMDKVILQTVYKNKEEKDVLLDEAPEEFIKVIAARPIDQKWDERLLDYTIHIDGNMANVWTPYEFWFNDTFSHCGVNSFQLFNDNGIWKIIYIIDTRRKQDCNQKNISSQTN